ncbi:hypothetical protein PLICRDRAFT_180918 [Plicaturopsis crispa FD-325 SS-3]|uniref:Uncharacterized protein n=1 Tax=Plicaturopsis crispa FD-325 SS-3 TaxID=944288 RepID=A0A0C9T482_PLICR|nr:hypothetical protein PLICRDRAFT_180918 [Plicaturopsis crispa FD-325 SS-3]
MADERTVSSFTWMNGGLRNRQEVRTLVDMTQIRQWHRHDPKKAEKIQRPTVKFYDLTEDIFGAIKSSAEVPPLENSSLYVDEDEEEVDDDSPGWTDDTLMIEEPADDFGSLEGDVDLDAPELVDVLADVGPQTHVEGNGATTPDHSDAGNGGMSDVEHSDDDADWGEW